LHGCDIYASVAGGFRAREPGIDLALALALASALRDRPVPEDLAAIGEVGLAGEVRAVPAWRGGSPRRPASVFAERCCPGPASGPTIWRP
ncbi:MAG: hypothetical protein ACREJP_00870, partial [Candidatus Methylomirabilales bacterium]